MTTWEQDRISPDSNRKSFHIYISRQDSQLFEIYQAGRQIFWAGQVPYSRKLGQKRYPLEFQGQNSHQVSAACVAYRASYQSVLLDPFFKKKNSNHQPSFRGTLLLPKLQLL